MKKLIIFTLLFVTAISLVACESGEPPIELTEPLTLSLFYELLEENGFEFRIREDFDPSFGLTDGGVRIELTEHYRIAQFSIEEYEIWYEGFTVYEFYSPEEALRYSRFVDVHGAGFSTPYTGIQFSPVTTVYWFVRCNIIVFYIGDIPEILNFFHEVFGEPFAGSNVLG